MPDAGRAPVAMTPRRVVVLGGGMAGIGAALDLLDAGCRVDLVESQRELGGLAGSFEQDGAFYPLGYHHVLATDRTLWRYLQRVGVAGAVRWRRVRLLFELEGRLHELGSPRGLLRFPLPAASRLRFLRLMLRATLRRDWTAWEGVDAATLVDRWADPVVRSVLFEPLARLKFDCSLGELSAAWLGARLHAREGASALGYQPGANWTRSLCDGLTRELATRGCAIHLERPARRLATAGGRVTAVELADGGWLSGDSFVSSVPVPVHRRLAPGDATPELAAIRYTALLSLVCATRQRVEPDFYWLNLASLDRTACAIFQLSSLNPTIGRPGETCLNFVTHLASRDEPLFAAGDDELLARYADDARRVLGLELRPEWRHVARVPFYSPVFERGFRNPPVRSTTFDNLYYAGNYRTYPAVASTGTALASGRAAAAALLAAGPA